MLGDVIMIDQSAIMTEAQPTIAIYCNEQFKKVITSTENFVTWFDKLLMGEIDSDQPYLIKHHVRMIYLCFAIEGGSDDPFKEGQDLDCDDDADITMHVTEGHNKNTGNTYYVLTVIDKFDERSKCSTRQYESDHWKSIFLQYYMDKHSLSVPDYPRKGVIFKDMSPILANPIAYKEMIYVMKQVINKFGSVNYIAGLDSRGYYFGPTLAHELGCGFIPVRKTKKIPKGKGVEIITEEFTTEYSEDSFGLIRNKKYENCTVVILDDLLATGGSIKAATKVLTNAGLTVKGVVTAYDVPGLRDKSLDITNNDNNTDINATYPIYTLCRPGFDVVRDMKKYPNSFFY